MSFESTLLTTVSIIIVIGCAFMTLAVLMLIISYFKAKNPNFLVEEPSLNLDELPSHVRTFLKFNPFPLEQPANWKELILPLDVYFKVFLVVAPLYSIGIIWYVLIIDFFKVQMILILFMWIQILVIMYLCKEICRILSDLTPS